MRVSLPRAFVRLSVWAGLMLLPVGAAGETLSYADLVHRLVDLERLALLPAEGEVCRQASSYDRASVYDESTGRYVNWSANNDGDGFIRQVNGRQVLAEIEGPGCIWRIWSAAARGGRVRIYIDAQDNFESATVNLPFNGYFNRENEPFTYPGLVYQTPSGYGYEGGYNSYVPIPFNQSCRIVADPGWGLYYHFTYSQFPEGTTVPSFKRDLPEEGQAALREVSDFFERRLGEDLGGPRENAETTVRAIEAAGGGAATRVAELSGPAAITALKVRMPEMDRKTQQRVLRELVLRITWDGAEAPAVWCPLGDFFGTAPGMNEFRALPVGLIGQGFYCYWYMPFATSARIEIVNDGAERRDLMFEIITAPLERPIESLGRFHAKWHRDAFIPEAETGRAIDWPLVKTTGRGRFVGNLLNVWNPRGSWWGEGDEKFFVDGEKFPSTYGTGSEDYYGYAWGLPLLFAKAFHSQTVAQPENRYHISVNRWHIADNVPFQTELEACIEKYYPNSRPTMYSAVGYWYLDPAGTDPYGPVPAEERVDYYVMPEIFRIEGVIEAEDLPTSTGAGFARFQDLTLWGQNAWSGDAHLWWTEARTGDRLSITFPVDTAGEYQLIASFTKAPDYGTVQAYLDGQPVGEPIDLYISVWVEPTGPVDLGRHRLTAGEHTLTLQITGKNENAANTYVGLDYLKLVATGTGAGDD